jgi:hypothetical protein
MTEVGTNVLDCARAVARHFGGRGAIETPREHPGIAAASHRVSDGTWLAGSVDPHQLI